VLGKSEERTILLDAALAGHQSGASLLLQQEFVPDHMVVDRAADADVVSAGSLLVREIE